ncbi:pseudaminic acid cytidylyltransferase [Raineya orbicola]|jgi:N-acylneuraminate cytidylyltransferase|uniref:PseF: pseudaminic acid CMP-transferase n=1 Tax=Raineya orbicola TaxID=2016530 RepID=A0A2N3IKV4_9BACT|nr:pseudaminic acid cytidylyltransferase [Raineya orbicola]PKQ70843.1 PseF: pseudaminic acid CMP-transferase [Raineya orbicola]
MNNIAIITARGGSKRIPRKNIKDFLGKPIIAYSIEASLKSGIFQEVMVSTDDAEIAEVAQKYGAKVPFMRSAKNSDDFATTADVLVEVLEEYQKRGQKFEYACCLYPTAPFVTAEKLQKAFNLLLEHKADSVVPVAAFSYPIWRSLKIENGKLQMNFPENLNKRSQDLPPAYHDVGQFYFFQVAKFLSTKKIFSDFSVPLHVSELEMQDIDNETDWKLAELKYQIFYG